MGVALAPTYKNMGVVWSELARDHPYPHRCTHVFKALPAEILHRLVAKHVASVLGRELEVVVGLSEGRAYADKLLHFLYTCVCAHTGGDLRPQGPTRGMC